MKRVEYINNKIIERTIPGGGKIFVTEKVQKTMDIIRKYSYGFNQKSNTEIEDAVLKSVVD
jgi:hypothetical protein